MTRTLRWSLGLAAAFAFALATAATAQATQGADGQAWSPAPFLFEAAEPHWLDAGVSLPGEAMARPDRPIAATAPAEVTPEFAPADTPGEWKTNPARYLSSPIYGRGVTSTE